MSVYINYNGALVEAGNPVISAASRAFRYGDGLFETIRMDKEVMPHFEAHMDRLFSGISILQLEPTKHFTREYLNTEIRKLVHKNKLSVSVRIRLSVFRGEGGLFDPENHHPIFIIEASNLPENYSRLNENGLVVDVFEGVCRHFDSLSALKTNNHLVYALAAIDAKKRRLNECLVQNNTGNICDGTLSNIFWIKSGQIFTPPLTEGGIGGVMRKFLLDTKPGGFSFAEKELSISALQEADEVFLTNGLYKIRWVRAFRDKIYDCVVASQIYRLIS